MELLKVIGLFALLILLQVCDSYANQAEARLRLELFPNPDEVATIPVENSSDVLDVMLKLYITQIVDMDEKNQVLTSKVWVKQVWHDYHLVWDPREYDNIRNLKVPNTYVWLPDILIYNNAYGDYDIQANTWVNIKYDGTVTWFPPAIYKSSCLIDVTWYPFDEQICKLKFGSWTHDGDTLNLIPAAPTAERKNYWPNGEWMIKRTPCTRHSVVYPCCAEPYVDITYVFVLIRKPLFYFAYLLLPCALISFNTMLVFYLPPDIGEKMALCTNVLLSLAVFLLLITAQIPANANSFPLIVKYLLFTMMVVASSIVLTVFVLNIRFRSPETHKMSPWVRRFFLYFIPPFLGMERPEQFSKLYKNIGISLTREAMENNIMNVNQLVMDSKENNYTVRMKGDMDTDRPESQAGPSEVDPFLFYMPILDNDCSMNEAMAVHNTIEELMYITWQYKKEVEPTRDREDWKYLAMVIDRIFLIVYVVGVFVGTFVILRQAPHSKIFFNELIFGTQELEWFEDPEANFTIHDYY